MKITKPFCIDDNLARELSKTNASKLVNDLLSEYFEGVDSMNISKLKNNLDKKSRKKKILLKEIKELRERIDDLERKEKQILKLTNKIPVWLMKSMQNHESWFTFATAFRNDINSCDVGREEIRKTFYAMKGGKK